MNYYTQFCVNFTEEDGVTEEIAAWAAARYAELDEMEWPGFDCTVKGLGILVYAEECGNNVDAANFIQEIIQRTGQESYVMEYCHYASRLVPDSCGGGAAYITHDDIEWMGSWMFDDWKMVRRFPKGEE